MSDENATAADTNPGIDLQAVSAGANAQITEFAQKFAKAVDGVKDPAQRAPLRTALDAAVKELAPESSAVSTKPAGASTVHPDHYKASQMIQMGVGVAAAVTQNPVLEMVSKLMAGDNKGEALARLEKMAGAAGIQLVGGIPLKSAISNAQAHSNTITAVKALAANGITGHIYPPDGANMGPGIGQGSKAEFVMQAAVKANKPEGLAEVKSLMTPPVKASEAMVKAVRDAGVKLGAGNTVKPKSLAEFQVVFHAPDPTSPLGKLTRRRASLATNHQGNQSNPWDKDLLGPMGYKPPTEPAPGIVADTNDVGKKHEEEMKRLEEERLMKEALELRARSRQAALKQAGDMGLIPKLELSPNPPTLVVNNYAFQA